ncbi:MAG: hypothetical protein GXP30_08990 [Verrucomicrobia bacterium]|nr:hypothetical protein [Verrucomicrobiota bacterium]
MKTQIKNLLSIITLITLTLSGICPVYSQRVRGSFEESEFKRGFDKKREAIFTPWGSRAQVAELLKKATGAGKVIFIVERNSNGEVRAAFDFPEKSGTQVCYVTAITESQLLAIHAQRKKNGYELLFLSENPGESDFCAVWIGKEGYKQAVGKLLSLGVTAAKIQIKPAQKSGPLTTETRQWKNKSGRIVEAALDGIDGDKIILVKKGGGRFPFLIADLSTEDQNLLKQLSAALRKPASEKLEAEPESGIFTEWLSFYDWNELLKAEKNKGRYPVYVENNKDRELRGVFEAMPDGMQFKIGWLDSEKNLLKMDGSYKAEGMTISSLSFDRRNELYYGIWVSKTALAQARTQLGAAGITPADIGRKIKVSKVSKK